MKSRFVAKWYKKEKFGEPIKRDTVIYTTGSPADAVRALKSAIHGFDGVVIESIQQYDDEKNEKIGEPFTPESLEL